MGKVHRGKFGKLKKVSKTKPRQDLEIEQLAHFTPEEEAVINNLVDTLNKERTAPSEHDFNLLRKKHTAAEDLEKEARSWAATLAQKSPVALQMAEKAF